MRNTLIRDSLGRYQGGLEEYWKDDDTYWEDHKEYDVRFPNYHKDLNSPVTTYNISELKNK